MASETASQPVRPAGSAILGAPAKNPIIFVMARGLFGIGVSTVAVIALGVLTVGGIFVLHRDDPDALDIWLARLRPSWPRRQPSPEAAP
jgi:hypothetical protein